MTSRYVSTDGTDSGPGSIEAPWATVVYAAQHAVSGDSVFILPGTYSAGAVPASDSVSYEGIGSVHIVGDGFPYCFYLSARNYISIRNISFSITGSAEATFGIIITDDFANHIPCTNILIHNCVFSDVNKRSPAGPNDYAVDIGAISYSDESLDQEGLHHLAVVGCTFNPGYQDMDSGIQVSHISINGNCQNMLFKNNTFNHTVGVYPTNNGCMEFAGNQIPQAFPDQSRKVVITGNILNWTGTPDTNRGSFYPTGCDSFLIERNTLNSWPNGIYIVAEDSYHHNTTSRVWLRRNRILNCAIGFLTGTFADNYNVPENIWFTNNTIVKVPGTAAGVTVIGRGVAGDAYIANNLIAGATPYIFNNTDFDSFNYNSNDTVIAVNNIDTSTPSWYTPGVFGDYEPDNELDINGSPCKYCRGAEEQVWTSLN